MNTYDFADSKEYASWERFFTTYLIEITEGTIYRYTKHRLNKAYLTEGNKKKIMRQLPELIVTED